MKMKPGLSCTKLNSIDNSNMATFNSINGVDSTVFTAS